MNMKVIVRIGVKFAATAINFASMAIHGCGFKLDANVVRYFKKDKRI